MEFAQSPPAYPIGPCIDDCLSANLNASLCLDAFLDAFKVSLLTLTFLLIFGFSCVFLLGLDVVLLGGALLIACLVVDALLVACLVVAALLPTCLVGGTLGRFGSLMVTPPLVPPTPSAGALLVVYKQHIHSS